jgi:hypothetical protein
VSSETGMVGRTGTGEDSGRETVASTGTGVSGTPPFEAVVLG